MDHYRTAARRTYIYTPKRTKTLCCPKNVFFRVIGRGEKAEEEEEEEDNSNSRAAKRPAAVPVPVSFTRGDRARGDRISRSRSFFPLRHPDEKGGGFIDRTIGALNMNRGGRFPFQ